MPTVALADPFIELSTPAGVPVHLHRTTAFKTVLLQWVAELPLDDGTPARALLPDLLTRATRSLPSLAAVAARCEELYSTELLSGASGFGDRQLVRFGFETVADRFTGRPLFREAVELLADVLHDPPLQDGAFRPDHLEQERANLVHAIEAIEDDKHLLAYRRMLEAMHAGTPFARHAWGKVAEARDLTEPPVRAAWEHVTRRAPARLFIVGEVSEEQALWAAERLAGGRHAAAPGPVVPPGPVARAPQELRDEQPLAQSKLAIGYRLPRARLPGSAAPLLGLVLGGDTFSRLFKRVREAESLAYGCSAAVSVETATLVVQAGIDVDKAPRVRELVQQELEALARDGVREEELALARRALLRRLSDLRDSPRALCAFRHAALLAGRPHELAAAEAAVQAATAEQIAALAAEARLDTTFLLAGKAA
jgi:predicted Zn-dependent peptidase